MTERNWPCNPPTGTAPSWTEALWSCFTGWLALNCLAASASRRLTVSAWGLTLPPWNISANSPSLPSPTSTSEETMTNAVLLEVPKFLHAPDWVAFESVLRNLWRLERTPAETLTEGLYGFAALAGAERYT